MDEETIRRLLQQASFDRISRDEIIRIRDQLVEAVPVDKSRPHSKAHLKRELIAELFDAAIDRGSGELPTLLPVFAILCRQVDVATNRKPRKPKKWERNRDAS